MTVVIKVENVSKLYQLGKVGTQSLKGDFNQWWAKRRGKEDPFAKIGEESQNQNGEFWALKDINFDVKQGDAIGIIGKNGAGKSTLLKILSRITNPTTGNIKIKGRIASLLEVGTGFNPDLTGRENIFLNGAILGMNKREIASKFDEIVDFSGVEKFIDTPVKRYSSGMYVRLAFAVAAHLESEILILDEVLAVGDADFQKKCLGKMDDVTHKQGRTILFVSHSIAAIKNLCNVAILLKKGKVLDFGDVHEIAERYIHADNKIEHSVGIIEWSTDKPGGEEATLNYIKLLNEKEVISSEYYTSESIKIEINYNVHQEIIGSRIFMQILDNQSNVAFASTNHNSNILRKAKGNYTSICNIPSNLLNGGKYSIFLQMGIPGVKVLIKGRVYLSFLTILMGNNGSTFTETWPGAVAPKLEWKTYANELTK